MPTAQIKYTKNSKDVEYFVGKTFKFEYDEENNNYFSIKEYHSEYTNGDFQEQKPNSEFNIIFSANDTTILTKLDDEIEFLKIEYKNDDVLHELVISHVSDVTSPTEIPTYYKNILYSAR